MDKKLGCTNDKFTDYCGIRHWYEAHYHHAIECPDGCICICSGLPYTASMKHIETVHRKVFNRYKDRTLPEIPAITYPAPVPYKEYVYSRALAEKHSAFVSITGVDSMVKPRQSEPVSIGRQCTFEALMYDGQRLTTPSGMAVNRTKNKNRPPMRCTGLCVEDSDYCKSCKVDMDQCSGSPIARFTESPHASKRANNRSKDTFEYNGPPYNPNPNPNPNPNTTDISGESIVEESEDSFDDDLIENPTEGDSRPDGRSAETAHLSPKHTIYTQNPKQVAYIKDEPLMFEPILGNAANVLPCRVLAKRFEIMIRSGEPYEHIDYANHIAWIVNTFGGKSCVPYETQFNYFIKNLNSVIGAGCIQRIRGITIPSGRSKAGAKKAVPLPNHVKNPKERKPHLLSNNTAAFMEKHPSTHPSHTPFAPGM